MTKSQLIIKLLHRFPDTDAEMIERMVNRILSEISKSLTQNNRVELRGFGAFSVRKRDPRMARNPKDGTSVEVGERYSIYFRAGKELRNRLNTDKLNTS